MTNEKLVIDLKGDKLIMGSDFHTLEDKTTATFKTNQIPEFTKFMAKGNETATIFCEPAEIQALPIDIDRYTTPLAKCSLQESDPLKKMRSMKGAPQALAAFTEFLEIYKRFTDAAGLDFLSSLRHFKMKKIVSVESKKEQNGDFSFNVSLETTGKEDFQPPATLVFEVPVFKFLSDAADCIRLSFEVNFSIVQGDVPVLNFVLNHFAFDDELQARQVEIVNRHLAELKQEKLWGTHTATVQNDSWKYQPNPLKDK